MSDKDNRKKWIVAVLCLLAVGLSAWSIKRQMPATRVAAQGGAAGGPGGGRQMPGTRGQITSINASAITIRPRSGAPQTFTLTATTKITVDQKPVAATALTVGQRARVVSTDNTTATEVHVRTRPFGRPGGGPPNGGGPGGGGSAPPPPGGG